MPTMFDPLGLMDAPKVVQPDWDAWEEKLADMHHLIRQINADIRHIIESIEPDERKFK